MFNSKNDPTSIFTSRSFSDFRLCGVPWNQPFLSTRIPWNASFSGRWYTSSVGMMTFTTWWESHKIPWFQSPQNVESHKIPWFQSPPISFWWPKSQKLRDFADFPRAKTPLCSSAQLLHAFALPGPCASIGAELHRQTEGIHGDPLRLGLDGKDALGMVISPRSELWLYNAVVNI